MAIAYCLEIADGVEVHVGFGVLVGEDQRVASEREGRAVLDFESVHRDVLGRQRGDVIKRSGEALGGLHRDAVHNVYVDVLEFSLSGGIVARLEISF